MENEINKQNFDFSDVEYCGNTQFARGFERFA